MTKMQERYATDDTADSITVIVDSTDDFDIRITVCDHKFIAASITPRNDDDPFNDLRTDQLSVYGVEQLRALYDATARLNALVTTHTQ